MALGREVHDGARAMLGKQPPHERAVGDVALNELMAPIAAHLVEIAHVAGIGELVQIDKLFASVRDGRNDEVRADETGAAGDEEHGADYPQLEYAPPRRTPFREGG